MPKVTGYQIREAIKRQTLLRDTAASMFTDSLKRFASEDKPSPDDMMVDFYKADKAIVKLQVAQMQYNLAVKLTTQVDRKPITLAEAVKRLGGASRCEKMWRTAATPETHLFRGDTRRKDEERAISTLTLSEAAKRSSAAAKGVAQLRQAIAIANATEIDLEDLDESLLQ